MTRGDTTTQLSDDLRYVENMNVSELPSSNGQLNGQREMAILPAPTYDDLCAAMAEEEAARAALVAAKVGVKKAKNAHDHAVTELHELGRRARVHNETIETNETNESFDGPLGADEPEG